MAASAARAAEAAAFGGGGASVAYSTSAVPAPMPPAGGGVKRALLCACNYRGTRAELQGCENDARCLDYLLRTKFGFTEVVMLLDTQPDPVFWPTRCNILARAHALASGARDGDSLFFGFSGHGAQVPDPSGDELDGNNEVLLPCDHEHVGFIVDDELNNVLVNPLPAGARMHALIDACHSGSALDLEWQAKASTGPIYWEQTYGHQPSVWKGSAGGLAVQIAASRDDQVAADTASLSGIAHTGAATFAFCHAVETYGTAINYDTLLRSMAAVLESVAGPSGGGGLPSLGGGAGWLLGLLSGVLGGSSVMSGQCPQLSSNLAFELTSPLCL